MINFLLKSVVYRHDDLEHDYLARFKVRFRVFQFSFSLVRRSRFSIFLLCRSPLSNPVTEYAFSLVMSPEMFFRQDSVVDAKRIETVFSAVGKISYFVPRVFN